jgi:hypothetical protein
VATTVCDGSKGLSLMNSLLVDFAVNLGCSDSGEPSRACCIFLPHQSPLGIYEHPQRQPTGMWHASFLCIRHGQVFSRSAEDVRVEIGLQGQHRRVPPFWRIECGCGHENCGTHHTIYTAGISSFPELVNRVLEKNPIVPCDSHNLLLKKELIHAKQF